ncbi:hypothetical protein FA13DRAFT_1729970, partial [Coprinellus micaceus]
MSLLPGPPTSLPLTPPHTHSFRRCIPTQAELRSPSDAPITVQDRHEQMNNSLVAGL